MSSDLQNILGVDKKIPIRKPIGVAKLVSLDARSPKRSVFANNDEESVIQPSEKISQNFDELVKAYNEIGTGSDTSSKVRRKRKRINVVLQES